MRRQDKYKNIEKANLILEQSYLKSKGLINEFDSDSWLGDINWSSSSDGSDWSFGGKWNKVPEENKEVLDKSTKKNVVLIYADSNTNYAIGEKNGKYYLYNFRQAENPGKPKEFNSIEDAQRYVNPNSVDDGPSVSRE